MVGPYAATSASSICWSVRPSSHLTGRSGGGRRRRPKPTSRAPTRPRSSGSGSAPRWPRPAGPHSGGPARSRCPRPGPRQHHRQGNRSDCPAEQGPGPMAAGALPPLAGPGGSARPMDPSQGIRARCGADPMGPEATGDVSAETRGGFTFGPRRSGPPPAGSSAGSAVTGPTRSLNTLPWGSIRKVSAASPRRSRWRRTRRGRAATASSARWWRRTAGRPRSVSLNTTLTTAAPSGPALLEVEGHEVGRLGLAGGAPAGEEVHEDVAAPVLGQRRPARR